jgi:hypothetical protein
VDKKAAFERFFYLHAYLNATVVYYVNSRNSDIVNFYFALAINMGENLAAFTHQRRFAPANRRLIGEPHGHRYQEPQS